MQPDYAFLDDPNDPEFLKWDPVEKKMVPTYTEEEKAIIRASWAQEKRAHVVACPRRPVSEWRSIIPDRFFTQLEQNQKIASCCRHPENHDIEAWYADDYEKEAGIPGIYIMHCTCGRKHRRVMAGRIDTRPFWTVR